MRALHSIANGCPPWSHHFECFLLAHYPLWRPPFSRHLFAKHHSTWWFLWITTIECGPGLFWVLLTHYGIKSSLLQLGSVFLLGLKPIGQPFSACFDHGETSIQKHRRYNMHLPMHMLSNICAVYSLRKLHTRIKPTHQTGWPNE